jgi:hypothetical protein
LNFCLPPALSPHRLDFPRQQIGENDADYSDRRRIALLEVPGTRSESWRSPSGRLERKMAMRYLLVRIALFSGITIVSAVFLAVPYLTIQ